MRLNKKERRIPPEESPLDLVDLGGFVFRSAIAFLTTLSQIAKAADIEGYWLRKSNQRIG
jgi:hypothetical protein